MSPPSLLCESDRRRRKVREAGLNGLDFLEVEDDLTTLCVHFLGRIPDWLIGKDAATHLSIEGGRRVRDIVVLGTAVDDHGRGDEDECLRVLLDKPGDASGYRLCIVDPPTEGPQPPYSRFDPRYTCVDFTFASACPADLDCAPSTLCPPDQFAEPSISYLAKDYATFRSLILDRLARLAPGWIERHVPDLGVTLVELLAYVGDELSYYQDAVATEAYLDTARHRISVRRHARLVDYHVHEGTAARAWIHVDVAAGDVELPDGAFFVTAVPESAVRGTIEYTDLTRARTVAPECFVPLHDGPAPVLRQAHNEILLYTWGGDLCCLPRGATTATLRDGPPATTSRPADSGDDKGYRQVASTGEEGDPVGRVLRLDAGDLLLFEEVLDPTTASPADADPTHRHVVRLTKVAESRDPLYGQALLEVEWAAEDALPFSLCISSIGPAPACAVVEPVSVARGNVVLVEHGRFVDETIGPVPEPASVEECEAPCRPADRVPTWQPFRPPPLRSSPLAFSDDARWWTGGSPTAAVDLIRQDPHGAVPVMRLVDDGHQAPPGASHQWEVRHDLLGSGPDDQHVVVEIDDARQAHLRFGDDELGQRPRAGTMFAVHYRVGGGAAGNVGAGTIVHMVVEHIGDEGGLRPRNPLAAVGGRDPEPVADVRLLAPHAFRDTIQRAVTADDYATLAERVGGPDVQAAGAELRWIGSWSRAEVAIDVRAGLDDAGGLVSAIAGGLGPYRRMGHDVAVHLATTVPLIVGLDVCVDPHHLRANVRAALEAALGSGHPPGGARGVFHPDNLTFGLRIDVSRIVAAAMAVDGVQSVTVTRLERAEDGPAGELEDGFVPIAPLEVARLDNDRNFPEHGRLELRLGGGR